MYTETLQQLGLPKNEAKIYEALLRLGEAGAAEISSTAKVNRRNVYDSLKNLVRRKLVSRVMQDGEWKYQTEDPKMLQAIVDTQRTQVRELLPVLKKVYKVNTPEEQIFISRGKEGIKNFWQYVLSQRQPVYFIGGKGEWHYDELEDARKKFYADMKKCGIVIKGIFDYGVMRRESSVLQHYHHEHIRILPQKYLTNSTYMLFCANRIVFIPMDKPRGFEHLTIFNIISKPLTDSYRTWFQFLWERAKKIEE